MLATVPADVEDLAIEFMGQPVRATSFAAEDVVALVRGAGFVVEFEQVVEFTPDHPEGAAEPHLFVYGRLPSA